MTTLDKYQIALVDTGNTNLVIDTDGNTTAAAPFDCRATPPLNFVTPSNWLTATVSFKVLPYELPGVVYSGSPTNAQLAPVYDETDQGILYEILTQSGYGYYRLPPTLFNGVRYINITSSAAQNANPIVSLVLTPLWQGIHS